MPRTHFFNSLTAVRSLERIAEHLGLDPVNPESFSQITEVLILKANQDLLAVKTGTTPDEQPLLTVKGFKDELEKMKKPIRRQYDPGIIDAVTLADTEKPSTLPPETPKETAA